MNTLRKLSKAERCGDCDTGRLAVKLQIIEEMERLMGGSLVCDFIDEGDNPYELYVHDEQGAGFILEGREQELLEALQDTGVPYDDDYDMTPFWNMLSECLDRNRSSW